MFSCAGIKFTDKKFLQIDVALFFTIFDSIVNSSGLEFSLIKNCVFVMNGENRKTGELWFKLNVGEPIRFLMSFCSAAC